MMGAKAMLIDDTNRYHHVYPPFLIINYTMRPILLLPIEHESP